MQPKPDERFGEADNGTWQGPPPGSASGGETTVNEPQPGSIGISTPTPGPSDDSHESEDFEDSTPKPGVDRSDEWDMLPPPVIAEGREIFGKFRLIQKIGEGGMGEVWLVDDLELDRKCALKLVKPEIAHNEKGWKRFRREARLMAKLDHPNAVAVHGFKRAHSMGYIEMEFVRGKSLDKYINERGGEQIPLDRIVTILDQLCAVLHEAHGHVDEKSGKPAPIIHRDLKPSNIMLVDRKPPGQDLKVLDFGIAKMLEEDGGPDATSHGRRRFPGHSRLHEPEQIRGGWGKDAQREVDGRSDLYSVGVLLYQLITGKLPFRAAGRASLDGGESRRTAPADEGGQPQGQRSARRRASGDAVPREGSREAAPERPGTGTAIPGGSRPFPLEAKPVAGQSARPAWHWPARRPGPLAPAVHPVLTTGRPWSPPIPKPAPANEPVRSRHALAPRRLQAGGVEPARRGLRRAPGDRTQAGRRGLPPHRAGNLPARRLRARDGGLGRQFRGLAAGHRPQAGERPVHPDPRRDLPSGRSRRPRHTTPTINRSRPTGSAFGVLHPGDRGHQRRDRGLMSNRHAGDAEPFQKWQEFYTKEKRKIKPEERARRLPAACISYLAARKFARERGGRLPTEAEWEFAAKSRDSKRAYPWGNDPPTSAREAQEGEHQRPLPRRRLRGRPRSRSSPRIGPIKASMTWPAT